MITLQASLHLSLFPKLFENIQYIHTVSNRVYNTVGGGFQTLPDGWRRELANLFHSSVGQSSPLSDRPIISL